MNTHKLVPQTEEDKERGSPTKIEPSPREIQLDIQKTPPQARQRAQMLSGNKVQTPKH